MHYGDEYLLTVPSDLNFETATADELEALFRDKKATRLSYAGDRTFLNDVTPNQVSVLPGPGRMFGYKHDSTAIIEVNDAVLREPSILRNRIGDAISFQFVLSVQRAERLGEQKNIHALGPALIVSAVPKITATYRMPRTNERVRHVTIFTTLSTFTQRLGLDPSELPSWLTECVNGRCSRPRQRVLFLDEHHRDLIWSCFHLPVEGELLRRWLAAKFEELLCVGAQIVKDNAPARQGQPDLRTGDSGFKLRRARTILNREYSAPPTVPQLAQRVGMSETQLKSAFKSTYGSTILQYCIDRRIEAAKLLLREKNYSIAEIADIIGYDDHSAFSRAFRRSSGISPREWRRAPGD